MCGEKCFDTFLVVSDNGSPPHVRGKDPLYTTLKRLYGITPACAGKRRFSTQECVQNQDHPRMCGEKIPCILDG